MTLFLDPRVSRLWLLTVDVVRGVDLRRSFTFIQSILPDLFRESLGKRLIFYVFSIYLLVAVGVTLVQLGLEYFRVRDTLLTDITEISQTISPGLSEQLWNFDSEGIHRSIQGIVKIEKVLGLQIFDKSGEIIGSEGLIKKEYPNKAVNSDRVLEDIFGHKFDILYTDDDGEIYKVGYGAIYSGHQVVLETLKYGFLLIIINSVIKTTVLWFIIYFFILAMVERPVNQLEKESRSFDPEHPDLDPIARKNLIKGAERSDQIGHLFQSYLNMRELIAMRLHQLQKLNSDGHKLAETSSLQETIALVESIFRDLVDFEKMAIFIESEGAWKCQFISDGIEPFQELVLTDQKLEVIENAGILWPVSQEIGACFSSLFKSDFVEKTKHEGFLVASISLRTNRKGLIVLSGLSVAEMLNESDRLNIESILQLFSSSFENADLIETITQSNQKLETAVMALKQSENRFKGFAESSADWFWEMGVDLQFTYLSERFEDVTGLNSRDLLGKKRWETIDLQDITDKWSDHKTTLDARLPFKNFEYWVKSKEGEELCVSINGVPVFDEKGKFEGYRGNGTDITRAKQLEMQVRRSQKMEAVGQLTGGIAHDFNNILAIVQGNLELLEEMAIDDEKALDRINKAQKGARRGVEITKKLLGFSRKGTAEFNQTAVNSFIQNIEELISKSLTASIKVETHLAEDLWPVSIDPGDLEDSILNLSINARDAMPDGGTLVIETSNKILDEEYAKRNSFGQTGEFVMISVSDTGSGMEEAIKNKVLEPFFTTKGHGKGTGLGLSMVYGFVQRSNGHLKIYSEVGKGTTIRLYLPRAKNAADEIAAATPDTKNSLPEGSETILIVDDEEDLRDVAATYLEHLGYTILLANSSEEALAVLENGHDVDLVFSDVVMPGKIDGYQLALKTQKKFPALKFLLTSGFTKKQAELNSGGNPYLVTLNNDMLSKPYNMAELAIALRHSLDDKKVA